MAMDYDGLLRANAKRVFSETSVERRLTALKELWAEDGVLVENEHAVTGREAVSGSVGTLLKMLPPGTTFEAEGPAVGHHGLGRLRWRAVDSSGKPYYNRVISIRYRGNVHPAASPCQGKMPVIADENGIVALYRSRPWRGGVKRCENKMT